jgi:hypothetical protein
LAEEGCPYPPALVVLKKVVPEMLEGLSGIASGIELYLGLSMSINPGGLR